MEYQSAASGAVPHDGTEVVADLAVLVRAAQAGDASALDRLIAAHLGLVYNIVGRALNGHADVDDLVQETMLRLVRGLPELRQPERFRSWLVAIALKPQHLAVRLQRQRTRLDGARAVVRALRAHPRCPELDSLIQGWSGVADARWRKRLTRHTRGCPHCELHRHGLVPPEDLLFGICSLPLPVAVADGLRTVLDAAAVSALSSEGSEGGDGSLDRPFATLGQAVAVIAPGETIAMRGGTYRPTDPVVIETDGEPERRITLSHYRDEHPVIDLSQVPADKWGSPITAATGPSKAWSS